MAWTPWSTLPTLQGISNDNATYLGVLATAPTTAGVLSFNDGSVMYNTPGAPGALNAIDPSNMFVTTGGTYPMGLAGRDVTLPFAA